MRRSSETGGLLETKQLVSWDQVKGLGTLPPGVERRHNARLWSFLGAATLLRTASLVRHASAVCHASAVRYELAGQSALYQVWCAPQWLPGQAWPLSAWCGEQGRAP